MSSSDILVADFSGQLYRCGLQLRLDREAAPPPTPNRARKEAFRLALAPGDMRVQVAVCARAPRQCKSS